MATPANRVPVRIARGTKANLDTAMAAGDLKEGEICYATDENGVYVVEGGVLTQAGADLAATSIDALSDVDTSTTPPTDGQILTWVDANSQWEPVDLPADAVTSVNGQTGDVTLVIDDLTDVTTAGVEAGWVLNFEYPDGTNSGVSNEGTIAYSDFNWNSCDISTDVAKFGSGSVDLRNSLAFLRAGTNFTSVEENSLAFGTGDFTVEAWVYWTTVASGSLHVIWEYNNSTASIGHFLHWNGLANTFTVRIQGGTTQTSSVVNLADATWHHLAVTRSSSTVQLFVNGTSVLSYTDGGNITGSLKSLLLGGGRNSGQNLGGYMDGFRLIKGTAVYTSDFTPPTVPPESFTPPADGQALAWVDARGRWEPVSVGPDVISDLSDVDTAANQASATYDFSGSNTNGGDTSSETDWGTGSGGPGNFFVYNKTGPHVADFAALQASDPITFTFDGTTVFATTIVTPQTNNGTNSYYLTVADAWPAEDGAATSVNVASSAFSLVSVPPSDGQVLAWVDANNQWEPGDYISKSTLQAEVAASTDFANFQTRIAAL